MKKNLDFVRRRPEPGEKFLRFHYVHQPAEIRKTIREIIADVPILLWILIGWVIGYAHHLIAVN